MLVSIIVNNHYHGRCPADAIDSAVRQARSPGEIERWLRAVRRRLALATIPNVIFVPDISLARVQNRARVVAVVQGALSGLGLGLSVVLLPRLGLADVGVAWLLSQTAVAFWVGLVLLRPLLRNQPAVTAPTAPGLKSTESERW